MDFRLPLKAINTPEDVEKLVAGISEIADSLDILYSLTAPNGNISGRQGQICLYNNSGTYTVWINSTGSTVWQQVDAGGMQYSDTGFVIIGSTRDLTAASGSVSYTGVGFKPRGLVFLGATEVAYMTSVGILSGVSAAPATDTQVSLINNHAVTANSWNVITNNICRFLETGSVYHSGSVASLDSDGFTISWTRVGSTAAGTATFRVLCIR